ncbi:hypothetical protein [Propionivibrio limicola]|uniref:hypothetical protein n=1 Tax=Propionivibrio limicola TaxID=167645 RepID=UPI0012914D0F|nr:hypothetical protein [Propionivibrio limicola]
MTIISSVLTLATNPLLIFAVLVAIAVAIVLVAQVIAGQLFGRPQPAQRVLGSETAHEEPRSVIFVEQFW